MRTWQSAGVDASKAAGNILYMYHFPIHSYSHYIAQNVKCPLIPIQIASSLSNNFTIGWFVFPTYTYLDVPLPASHS